MGLKGIALTTERGLHGISKGLGWVAAVTLAFMALVGTTDVLGRCLFNQPLLGTQEITELLMVTLAFSAFSYTTMRKAHTRVQSVLLLLGKRTQDILEAITYLLGAGFIGLVGCGGVVRLIALLHHEATGGSSTTIVLRIPIVPFVFVLVIGSVVFSLELLVISLQSLSRAVAR